MPLRGLIDGREVIAPLLTDEEWRELGKALKAEAVEVRLPCCESAVGLRRSSLGLKHFYHRMRTPACGWGPESWQHLEAKMQIRQAALEAGWEVHVEVTGKDWRADVLATRGIRRVAFEVQWSAQTLEETLERQERYARDGVWGCWLFRRWPRGAGDGVGHLPVGELQIDDAKAFSVVLNGSSEILPRKILPLPKFVGAALGDQVRFCRTLRERVQDRTRVVFFEYRCWKCKRMSYLYFLADEHVSACGGDMSQLYGEREFAAEGDAEDDEGYGEQQERGTGPLAPEVVESVRAYLESEEGRHLRVGEIKPRHSRTLERSYVSFGCYWCDALFGAHYVWEEMFFATQEFHYTGRAAAVAELEIRRRVAAEVAWAHWCCPEEREFCSASALGGDVAGALRGG